MVTRLQFEVQQVVVKTSGQPSEDNNEWLKVFFLQTQSTMGGDLRVCNSDSKTAQQETQG